ncbi:BCCT family transporter [Paenibacillus sp. HB172176]|uniref:glycine betaine uptake BCCT transporter n=1 Tax=Paenibacillus sp. HB172176 TaxID=2493690 RepID=UPI001439BBBB|nr:BCCT family transporter [Paenibacillus sp. HB172176]
MKSSKLNANNPVFWISSILLLLFVIWGAAAPNQMARSATRLFDFTTYAFGWFYLLAVFLIILFCLFLAFSKYGKIRLGKDEDRPRYSFFTWVGMLFSAGFGVGLVFWGVAEPMSHFFTPPIKGVEPLTPDAARLAMRYAFFHWGISQWSVFTIVGLALAYFQFRKDKNGLISTTLDPLIGQSGKSYLRAPIDILAVIATITGVATSLGMGILQINGGLNHQYGIPNSTGVQLIIIAVLLVLYLISSTTGLDRGIKWLSNLNLSLALLLMVFIFAFGPTVFILNSLVLGVGDYIQHFIETSLRLTPYKGGTWVRDWTIFYWAWAIAWSPFVSSFVARVSRGRTIREFVAGVLFIPPLIAVIWMAVFGGSALKLDLKSGEHIADSVQNDVSSALFVTLQHFPMTEIMSALSILLIITFLVTSADSATFVLGMMTTNGSLEPPFYIKIVWGTLMAAIAAVLLISSGLQGLQTASLIAALPFTVIMVLIGIALFKSIKQEPKRAK